MFDYMIGMISKVEDSIIILENGGVGYEIYVPLPIAQQAEPDQKKKIFIHQHINENEHTLYGFSSRLGKAVFRLLITVSGVGPKMAIRIFDQFSTEEILQNLSSKSIVEFKKVKGLGSKTVEKIIIELHKKSKEMMLSYSVLPSPVSTSFSLESETIEVLVGLGYKGSKIRETVIQTIEEFKKTKEIFSSELVIKKVLEKMAKLK